MERKTINDHSCPFWERVYVWKNTESEPLSYQSILEEGVNTFVVTLREGRFSPDDDFSRLLYANPNLLSSTWVWIMNCRSKIFWLSHTRIQKKRMFTGLSFYPLRFNRLQTVQEFIHWNWSETIKHVITGRPHNSRTTEFQFWDRSIKSELTPVWFYTGDYCIKIFN